MNVIKNPDGTLTIPVRVEADDGTIGDAVEVISKDHPQYAEWLPWAKEQPRKATDKKPNN